MFTYQAYVCMSIGMIVCTSVYCNIVLYCVLRIGGQPGSALADVVQISGQGIWINFSVYF